MKNKHRYIYCNKCERFYLKWDIIFSSPRKKVCPICLSSNIEYFESESFTEMVQIERMYKVNKIKKKLTNNLDI